MKSLSIEGGTMQVGNIQVGNILDGFIFPENNDEPRNCVLATQDNLFGMIEEGDD